VREFHPADYGPVLAPLVSGDRNRPLDAGHADPAFRSALQLANVESAFAQTPLADRDTAVACIAGVWLVHDFLDESHAISQHIDTPEGAFWHGIMHRREGDFANAKYWFRRVGDHKVYGDLSAAVSSDGTFAFDPYSFVDLCQRALRSSGDSVDHCRRVQQLEWELLFDFCYRRAVGE
jgi:hypothetical protein